MNWDASTGPTASQLRARALAVAKARVEVLSVNYHALALEHDCLACGRPHGAAMCDLCQRLENAEAKASGSLDRKRAEDIASAP